MTIATKIDKRLLEAHPGDEVQIVGTREKLREINLHDHYCRTCKVEEVRPHKHPDGETVIKLTCGYVAPVSYLKFIRCRHQASPEVGGTC